MRIIYEKFIDDSFVECDQSEAEYVHYCYNDEKTPSPCRREKL